MSRFNCICVALLLVLSACASTEQRPEEPETHEPKLISKLPSEIETFSFDGYRFFEDNSAGYTLRFSNARKHRLADVYIYPVAEQNEKLDHNTLVMGSTRATIQAIGLAVNQGIYSNFNVVGAATRVRGFRTVARVEATYLRENLASYTLVYQTEYDGTLMKIRLSMPDNESNRSSTEWDRFAERMFTEIVDNLDDERKAANKLTSDVDGDESKNASGNRALDFDAWKNDASDNEASGKEAPANDDDGKDANSIDKEDAEEATDSNKQLTDLMPSMI